MSLPMKKLFSILIFGMAFVAGAVMISPPATGQNKSAANTLDHVFVIMMENESYETLIGNPNAPWINSALAMYGFGAQYYGVAHPSQPNYIAVTSGSTHGVADDEEVTLNVRNLVDQLEAAGKSWKDYQQSISLCRRNRLAEECKDELLESSRYSRADHVYVRKHNPFVSYLDVQTNPARMAKVVDLSELDSDLASGNVPDFSWISPDLCNDMHGRHSRGRDNPCDFDNGEQLISAGDSFLRTWVGKIMGSKAWTERSVIFITWDESDDQTQIGYERGCCNGEPGGGHIIMLVISNANPGPRRSSRPYNHYSLLATIEDAWNLGCLANTCKPNVARMFDLVGPPR